MAYASHVRGICQRCGFEFRRNQIHKEWTGLLVCKGPGTNHCFDKRHPQEFVRGKPDKQSIANPAPDPADLILPPPGSAYHLDFERNQGWTGTTHNGTAASMLTGSPNITSDGLVLTLTSQVYMSLSAYPLTMTGGFYGRLIVDLTEASEASFGVLLNFGDGVDNDPNRTLFYNDSNDVWAWTCDTPVLESLSDYEQEETTFVFGFAGNYAQLIVNEVAGLPNTTLSAPSDNSAVLALGWRYFDNALHQPCTMKSLTLYEGAANEQRLELLTHV